MKSTFHAWSSGDCYGFRRLRDSVKDLLTIGPKIAKYHEVINMASEATFTLPFGGFHTPRMCLLRSLGVVLDKLPETRLGRQQGDEGMGTGRMACSSTIRR